MTTPTLKATIPKTPTQETQMTYSELIQEIWQTVYDPEIPAKDAIEKYFHEDYEQSINDEIMNREQFIEHVLEQKSEMTVQRIEYVHFVENDKDVFAIYYPFAIGKDGGIIRAEVMAHFQFKGHKVYRIQGKVEISEEAGTEK